MHKALLIGILVVGITALGGMVYGHGMSGSGMMAMGYRASWPGYNMGPMTPTGCCGSCYQMMQQSGGYYGTSRTEELTKNDAENMVRDYLYRSGNPNLKQGKVTETDHEFEVELVTKDNSLVEKILIDKQTGWMTLTYQKFPFGLLSLTINPALFIVTRWHNEGSVKTGPFFT